MAAFKIKTATLFFCLATFGVNSNADNLPVTFVQPDRLVDYETDSSYPYSNCFAGAAKAYKVDENLIKAIAWTESRFNPAATNTANATPTEDVGIMQINSWWLDNHLNDMGLYRNDLLDACTNIYIGSWILANEIKLRGDIWTAVGYYNARTEYKRKRYTKLVKSAYKLVLSGEALAKFNKINTAHTIPNTFKSFPAPKWKVVKESLTYKKQNSKKIVASASLQKTKPKIKVIGG